MHDTFLCRCQARTRGFAKRSNPSNVHKDSDIHKPLFLLFPSQSTLLMPKVTKNVLFLTIDTYTYQ